MRLLHLKHNLRTAGLLVLFTAVLVMAATLWWANHTGLPQSWRSAIEQEIAKHGAHVEIGSLRYLPLIGLTATDLQVFSDAAHQKKLSSVERVILDFDKTKMARGVFRLTKLQLRDATLRLPVDPAHPDAEMLEMTEVNGSVFMRGGRLFDVRNVRGKIAGIEVKLGARVLAQRTVEGGLDEGDPDEGKRRELIARTVRELAKWKFDSRQPPSLRIHIEGDLNDRSTFTARLALDAGKVGKNGHTLEQVTAEAKLEGELLTFTSIRAHDGHGRLEARLDYDLGAREGRFDARSTLELPPLLDAWTGISAPDGLVMADDQSVEIQGAFSWPENAAPQVRATGRARAGRLTLHGVSFDSVETAFAAAEGNYYLRDFHLVHPAGEVRGKLLAEDGAVRLLVETSLPPSVCRPFLRGHPLERVVADFTESEGAEVAITVEGRYDLKSAGSWAYSGHGAIDHLAFRGVPVESADCRFSLSPHELDFFDGSVVFDYQDYPLKRAFQGPGTGTLTAQRIRYDALEKVVEIENVEGTAWAAPIVRMFAARVADSLEQYRFHRPPRLKASGKIDVTRAGRTNLGVSFDSTGRADYKFLGKTITVKAPSGRVAVRGGAVSVDDLSLTAFEGPVDARFTHAGGRLTGEASWTRLSLPQLGSSYGFETKGGGEVTGRIEFSLRGNEPASLRGKGVVGVDRAELFSVPVFGPLTPLVAGVLNDPQAGSEMVRNAFLTFEIQDGVLRSSDFQTSTPSLVFTGDGAVDLKSRTVDLTVRMNARGFLGVITLPLRPFYGLFQFHGTGPLKNPEWRKVRFTDPPAPQATTLLEAPKAMKVEGD